MALYDTVANIVSEVAVECGLGAVSDVYASTDANIIQMRGLLKSTGRRLILKHPFLQCILEHTFTTTSETSYTLPSDYQSMVSGSGWNRTQDLPLYPTTPQLWQHIKAIDTGVQLATHFRLKDLTLEIHSPSSGETIALEYRSRFWVAGTGSTIPSKDAPTLNADVVILDAELIKAALKLSFLAAKGFDVASAAAEFASVLRAARAASVGAAPVLSLNNSGQDEKLIDLSNSPSTGFGFDGLGGLF